MNYFRKQLEDYGEVTVSSLDDVTLFKVANAIIDVDNNDTEDIVVSIKDNVYRASNIDEVKEILDIYS